jgi:hypothetical protein
MAENDKPKRKRGRPPKKKVELPKFNNENEIREYILATSLELALECKELATKKNNIKKTTIANAKNNQYKTALESLKVVNAILKDLQLTKLSEKVELMEEGLIASTVANSNEETELPSETIEKIQKLTELTEELATAKE